MKTIKHLFHASIIVLALYACGNGNSAKKEATVSPEMEAFMKQLNGKAEQVSTALTQYGAESLDKKDMDMYDLEKAKVVSADKNCYTMEAGAGMTVRTYVLCWEGAKIKSIEDKGMK